MDYARDDGTEERVNPCLVYLYFISLVGRWEALITEGLPGQLQHPGVLHDREWLCLLRLRLRLLPPLRLAAFHLLPGTAAISETLRETAAAENLEEHDGVGPLVPVRSQPPSRLIQ